MILLEKGLVFMIMLIFAFLLIPCFSISLQDIQTSINQWKIQATPDGSPLPIQIEITPKNIFNCELKNLLPFTKVIKTNEKSDLINFKAPLYQPINGNANITGEAFLEILNLNQLKTVN